MRKGCSAWSAEETRHSSVIVIGKLKKKKKVTVEIKKKIQRNKDNTFENHYRIGSTVEKEKKTRGVAGSTVVRGRRERERERPEEMGKKDLSSWLKSIRIYRRK